MPQQPTTNTATRKQIYGLVIVLFITSISACLLRNLHYSSDSLAGDDQLWNLTLDVEARSADKPVKLSISPPHENNYIRVIERSIFHPNMKVKTSKKELQRNIVLTARDKTAVHINVDFLLQTSESSFQLVKTDIPLSTKLRELYLSDTPQFELYSYNVQQKLRQVMAIESNPEKLSIAIFEQIKKIANSNKPDQLNVAKTLTLKQASTLDRTLAMVALCRAAGIPARLVTGLIIQDNPQLKPHYWMQTYENNQWNNFDLKAGYMHDLPKNYLALRYNNPQLVSVENGDIGKLHFHLKRAQPRTHINTEQSNKLDTILDLRHLNFDKREDIALLLLLPFGALITAFFRYLIGIQSYGVFTPTLLALAMVYADITSTLIIFIVVCTLAIAGRSLFPKAIDRTVRLSIIFTLIAFILAYSESVLDTYKLNDTDAVILLPIIILTSLVDRLYRTIEEKGITIAIHRLIWTAIITLACLPVIQFETLGQLLIRYPEIHFSTLAILLLLATYKGKTFINHRLLKWLSEPPSTRIKSPKK